MSDDKQNQGSQSTNAPAVPTTSPPATSQGSAASTAKPPEDPFALDKRLIGNIQKGGDKPAHTAIVRPEIVREKPTEKK